MSLTRERHAELKRYAIQLRRLVVESVHHAGAGHLGGPMSAAELLVALYFAELNIDPAQPRDEDRDRFILSKGTPRSASTRLWPCAVTYPLRNSPPLTPLTPASKATRT